MSAKLVLDGLRGEHSIVELCRREGIAGAYYTWSKEFLEAGKQRLLAGGTPGPTFFVRTTLEICSAIMARDDPAQLIILKKHMVRIQEPRLRRAWEAALGLNNTSNWNQHEAILTGKELIFGRFGTLAKQVSEDRFGVLKMSRLHSIMRKGCCLPKYQADVMGLAITALGRS
jgi:transposase-like protein